MSNNINVSLDTSVTPNALDVHDHGHIRVRKQPGAQTITWNLTGQIAQGCFVPMTDEPPGFQWIPQVPPAGIFGVPTIGQSGNSLSITDTHADDETNGVWVYQLRVKYQGTVYATTATIDVKATMKDPIIINR